jgi:hypothetical protein
MQSVHQITLKALERPAIRDQYAGSMEPVLLIIAIFGFFIGSVAVQQTFRWIALLSVVTSDRRATFLARLGGACCGWCRLSSSSIQACTSLVRSWPSRAVICSIG